MVNVSESVINPVILNMPKMLTGMHQKVRGRSRDYEILGRGQKLIGKEPTPKLPLSLARNTVSPHSRLQGQADHKESR